MNKFKSITKPMMWSTTLVLAAILAGCGGGGSGGTAATALSSRRVGLLWNKLRESWHGCQLCDFGRTRVSHSTGCIV